MAAFIDILIHYSGEVKFHLIINNCKLTYLIDLFAFLLNEFIKYHHSRSHPMDGLIAECHFTTLRSSCS